MTHIILICGLYKIHTNRFVKNLSYFKWNLYLDFIFWLKNNKKINKNTGPVWQPPPGLPLFSFLPKKSTSKHWTFFTFYIISTNFYWEMIYSQPSPNSHTTLTHMCVWVSHTCEWGLCESWVGVVRQAFHILITIQIKNSLESNFILFFTFPYKIFLLYITSLDSSKKIAKKFLIWLVTLGYVWDCNIIDKKCDFKPKGIKWIVW
jgi:hypothetical protein